MKFIGVDIGGTFTDVSSPTPRPGTCAIHKVPTTPDDPSLGMLHAVRELCERESIAAAEVGHLFHGTTIATNAVLTHEGARTGMITSEGYRDILHIGRHQRPQHYSIRQEIPWQDRPFVRRRRRLTVPERITPPAGEVLTPLDEEAVRRAARRLRTTGWRRSRSASSSPGSTPPTRSGRRPSCARSTRGASSPPPPPCRPSSGSSSGSPPPR